MPGRVVLTHAPYRWDGAGRAFAVVAPGYEAPGGIEAVPLEDLMSRPQVWLDGSDVTMIVVGLSKLLTPSNRVRVGRVLLRPRDGLTRISVDRQLFVCDPWRMWWHFHAVGAERWGFTDSFIAETRWKSALEMRTEDPFGEARVIEACRGVVDIRDPFAFGPIVVETRDVTPMQRGAYAELKEMVFAEEKTVSAIIKRLSSFAKEACPERSVPSPAHLYARPPTRIICTDLAVDRFLVGQLMHRVRLTNAIAGRAEPEVSS